MLKEVMPADTQIALCGCVKCWASKFKHALRGVLHGEVYTAAVGWKEALLGKKLSVI